MSEIQKIMARNFTGNLTENYESNKIFHQNVNVAKKKAKVIWIASNCKASSRREDYVQDLAKYVDLEIYGKCGKHPGLLEFEDLIVGHQFYLAFENEVSLDYFTEKLCRAMKTNVIPVVLGGAEYSKIVPPRSVINVANFESPRALGNYLNFLANNPMEYGAYVTWKRAYRESPTIPRVTCQICNMLNQNQPSIRSLKSWWIKP